MIIPRAVLLANLYRSLPFITVPFEAKGLNPPVTQKLCPRVSLKSSVGQTAACPFYKSRQTAYNPAPDVLK